MQHVQHRLEVCDVSLASFTVCKDELLSLFLSGAEYACGGLSEKRVTIEGRKCFGCVFDHDKLGSNYF